MWKQRDKTDINKTVNSSLKKKCNNNTKYKEKYDEVDLNITFHKIQERKNFTLISLEIFERNNYNFIISLINAKLNLCYFFNYIFYFQTIFTTTKSI